VVEAPKVFSYVKPSLHLVKPARRSQKVKGFHQELFPVRLATTLKLKPAFGEIDLIPQGTAGQTKS